MRARVGSVREHARIWLSQRGALIGATSWVSLAFVVQQALRFGTSVALAWLLAPALLGTMLLINTLRTGGELLTDIGIGQSIINNKNGGTRAFYNTAWTIQIIRGFFLFAVFALVSWPLAAIYEVPDLRWFLLMASGTFIISGFASPARFLLQRQMRLKKIALVDIAVTVAAAAFQIIIAALSPTIWALLAGLLFATLLQTISSFVLMGRKRLSIKLDTFAASSIVSFGKWIFLASIIYFASLNFDRLYFADKLTLASLGIYGIARSISDTIVLLGQRISSTIVFPKVSSLSLDSDLLRNRIYFLRLWFICAISILFSFAVSFSDLFVEIVYDDRYQEAGRILPLLLIGAWFSVLSALGDAIMMGIGRPSSTAWSNGVKFIFIVVSVPIALANSFLLAVGFLVLAEMVRWGALSIAKARAGVSFVRQDLIATLFFFICAMVLREVSGLIGVTGGLESWASIIL